MVELKDLIIVPNIADRLRPPVKSDKILGPHKESWCEFHEAFGHHINNCLALGYQLDELVKKGFLKDYLVGSTVTPDAECQRKVKRTKSQLMEKCTPSLAVFTGEDPLPLNERNT